MTSFLPGGASGGWLGNRWVAVGLFVLFVPLAWRAWSKLASASAAAAAADAPAPSAPAAASAPPATTPPAPPTPHDLELLAEQDERRALPVPLDPFRAQPAPASEVPAAPPNLRLEALSECGGRALAVIEDHVLAVGEEIGEFRVESIGVDRVTLRRGERRFVLELLGAEAEGPR